MNFGVPVQQLRELVAKEKYDIVHVHTPVAAFVARLALRELKSRQFIKVVYTAHGFHFYKGGNKIKNCAYLTAEKVASRWTDHLVVINDEDYEAAIRWLLPLDKITLMPGIGIDFQQYNTSNIKGMQVKLVRDELGLREDDKLVLMVAEFVPRKRHADVVKAMQIVNYSKVHIAFAGNGPLLEQIKKMANLSRTSERIHFLGQRHDVPVLIAASCATILPSQQEGLPRAIMESMAQRVPVIGTNIRGSRDLLQNGCGIIVEVGDIAGLASAIDYLVSVGDAERENIVNNAYKRVSGYDIQNIQRMHEKLYKSLLKK